MKFLHIGVFVIHILFLSIIIVLGHVVASFLRFKFAGLTFFSFRSCPATAGAIIFNLEYTSVDDAKQYSQTCISCFNSM
jgi:hypothetical protein